MRSLAAVLLAAVVPVRAQTSTIDTVVAFSTDVTAVASDSGGRTFAVARSVGTLLLNGADNGFGCGLVLFDPAAPFPPPVQCVRGATTALIERNGSALFAAGSAGMTTAGTATPLMAKLTLPFGPPIGWQLSSAPSTPLPVQIDRIVEAAAGVIVASGPRASAGESVVLRVDAASGAAEAVLVVGGPISALAIASDGGVLVGGAFTFDVAGQSRRGLLKLLPGSLQIDPGYADGPGVALSAVAGAADGAAYVARSDTSRVVRVDAGGAVDGSWITVADGTVHAIAIDAGQRVYLAGAFSTVNGASRRGVARVSPLAGAAVDAGWAPEAIDGTVTGIQVDAESVTLNGAITAPFSHQAGVVRLSLTTASPPAPEARIRLGDSDSSGSSRIATQVFPTDDGDLVVVGPFSMTARRVVPGAVRVDRFGNERTAWTPPLRGRVLAGVAGGDGSVFLSGRLARQSDAQALWQTVRVTGPDAAIDSGWVVVAQNGAPEALAVEAPWLYLLGAFSSINAIPVGLAARVSLAAPATLDVAYSPTAACCVLADYRAIIAQSDGSALLNVGSGGDIDFEPPPPPGPPVQVLLRLQPQSSGPSTLGLYGPLLDSSLDDVQRVLADGRGDVHLLGRLRPAADPSRLGIVRLLPDGAFDPSMANFTAECRPYGPGAVGADGLLYLACEEPGGGSSPTRRLLRLVPGTGDIDRDWFVEAPELAFLAATHVATAADRVVVLLEQGRGGPLPLRSFSTAARPLFADGMESAAGP